MTEEEKDKEVPLKKTHSNNNKKQKIYSKTWLYNGTANISLKWGVEAKTGSCLGETGVTVWCSGRKQQGRGDSIS